MELLANLFGIVSNLDFIVRFGLIILIALYGLFALIVVVQVSNLNKVLHQVGSSEILSLLSIAHLLATLALLLFTVLSL